MNYFSGWSKLSSLDWNTKSSYSTKNRPNSDVKFESVSSKAVYHQNKYIFDGLKSSRKINLFEQSGLLDEENIREEIK